MRYALPGDVKSFEEYRNGEVGTSQTSMFEGVAYDFPDSGVDTYQQALDESGALPLGEGATEDNTRVPKGYTQPTSFHHTVAACFLFT